MSEQTTRSPLLQVENLKMYFPTGRKEDGKPICVKAVDGISFQVCPGETFGLVGESGCGKTTAGKAILRVLTPTEGRVITTGRTLRSCP